MATLRYGDRGTNVTALQNALNKHKVAIRNGNWDYPHLVPDGVFGAKTSDAVRNFNVQRGLGYTNVVSEQTWAALGLGTVSFWGVDFGGKSTTPTTTGGGNSGGGNNNGGGSNLPADLSGALEAERKRKEKEQQQQLLIFGGFGLLLVLLISSGGRR